MDIGLFAKEVLMEDAIHKLLLHKLENTRPAPVWLDPIRLSRKDLGEDYKAYSCESHSHQSPMRLILIMILTRNLPFFKLYRNNSRRVQEEDQASLSRWPEVYTYRIRPLWLVYSRGR